MDLDDVMFLKSREFFKIIYFTLLLTEKLGPETGILSKLTWQVSMANFFCDQLLWQNTIFRFLRSTFINFGQKNVFERLTA